MSARLAVTARTIPRMMTTAATTDWAGPRARAEHDLEAYEAEADGGEPRGDGYNEGYDHGRCDAAGVRDDQSEYGDGDAGDPERYEQWYYEEFYGDAEDHGGGEPWSGAVG